MHLRTSIAIDSHLPRGLTRTNVCISLTKRKESLWRSFASPEQVAAPGSLQLGLEQIDQYLSADDEAAALEITRSLKESGLLVGFDAGRRIPKQNFSLSDLRMHKIDATKLLAPKDNTLSRLKSYASLAYIVGVATGVFTDLINISTASAIVIVTGILIGVDQIRTGGGVEFLLVELLASVFQTSYEKRVALHEAGHFLVAYLSGLLPKKFTLSAIDYYKKYGKFNIQAGTTFCDSEFQKEIREGQLKASSLDRYTCVAVAGVVAEYLSFGHSEGGLNDILQLDQLMRSLKFSQKKVDSEVRWAVMNTVSLLRRHRTLHRQLAEHMKMNHSVKDCISLVEKNLKDVDDI